MEKTDTHCIWNIWTQTVGWKAIWNGWGERTDGGSYVLSSSFNLNIIYHNFIFRLISFWLPREERTLYWPLYCTFFLSFDRTKKFSSLFSCRMFLELHPISSHFIPSHPISLISTVMALHLHLSSYLLTRPFIALTISSLLCRTVGSRAPTYSTQQ